MNKLILIGRLGQDPTLKTPKNTECCEGSIATTYKYKSGSEYVEAVTWITFVIWGKGAGIFHQYTKKGSQVMLEGRLQSKSWETNNGEKKTKLFLNVENFEFLSTSSAEKKETTFEDMGTEVDDEEIPF